MNPFNDHQEVAGENGRAGQLEQIHKQTSVIPKDEAYQNSIKPNKPPKPLKPVKPIPITSASSNPFELHTSSDSSSADIDKKHTTHDLSAKTDLCEETARSNTQTQPSATSNISNDALSGTCYPQQQLSPDVSVSTVVPPAPPVDDLNIDPPPFPFITTCDSSIELEPTTALSSPAQTTMNTDAEKSKAPIPLPKNPISVVQSKSSKEGASTAAMGPITAPKKLIPTSGSMAGAGGGATKQPTRLPAMPTTRSEMYDVRPSRSKSMRVNILQSAFIETENVDTSDRRPRSNAARSSDMSGSRSMGLDSDAPVVKPKIPRGVSAHGRSKSEMFSRPKSWSPHVPEADLTKAESGISNNSLESGVLETIPISSSRSHITPIPQNRRSVSFQKYSAVPGNLAQNHMEEGSISSVDKMTELIKMNAIDDGEFALENELLDSASCRPVSRNCGRGQLSRTRMDSFHMQYPSDSTDTDDSNDDAVSERSSVEAIENRRRESDSDVENVSKRKSRQQGSSRNIENENKNKAKRRKKKIKKAKLARRAAALEKKRAAAAAAKASSSSRDGGPGITPAPHVMTEREKRVAKYRSTLERIDRKLQKEGVGEVVKCVDDKDENATIRFLLSGRVYGFPGTDGSLSSNYIVFLKQKHPLLSLFLHHRHHPLKTPRRLVIFCCVLSFAFIMSVILLEGFYFEEEFICAGGCGRDSTDTNSSATFFETDNPFEYLNSEEELPSTGLDATFVDDMLSEDVGADVRVSDTMKSQSLLAPFEGVSHVVMRRAAEMEAEAEAEQGEEEDVRRCHGGVNDGLEYDKYHRSCQFYPPWVISFIAGALITPYDLLLKFMATCGCVQGRAFFQTNCCGVRCKGLVTHSGDIALASFVFLNILCTLAALYRAYFVLTLGPVLTTFLLSEIVSFGYWIGWTVPYFSFKYPSDRKVFYKALRKERKKKWHRDHPNETMNSGDGDYDNFDSAV